MDTNLSEEHPDVIIKEWSCFPSESDLLGMHDWRRCEKRDGFDHISDLNLSKASLISPLEQRLVNCSIEEVAELVVFVETRRGALWREHRDLPIHLACRSGLCSKLQVIYVRV